MPGRSVPFPTLLNPKADDDSCDSCWVLQHESHVFLHAGEMPGSRASLGHSVYHHRPAYRLVDHHGCNRVCAVCATMNRPRYDGDFPSHATDLQETRPPLLFSCFCIDFWQVHCSRDLPWAPRLSALHLSSGDLFLPWYTCVASQLQPISSHFGARYKGRTVLMH